MAGLSKRRLRAAATAAIVAAAVAPAGASAQFEPGAPGVGDPFFPNAGNGGYDVSSYRLDLDYSIKARRLDASTKITATALQDLSSFNLDFRGPKVRAVSVNGVDTGFERQGQELVVTPAAGVAEGASFTTVVAYRGRPGTIKDDDGSREGWFETDDGSVVVAEPQGAPTWYPSNDHPTDKARFAFRIRVPDGIEAVANGAFRGRFGRGRGSEWRWRTTEPMSPYLATVATGQFKIIRGKVGGIASFTAVDPELWKKSKHALRRSGKILSLFERLFGRYPFGQTGAIVDDAKFIGYALETQTRPVYDSAPSDVLIAHELAHQWFGDSVGLARWQDMWLNEGFATWAEWRWKQEAGGSSTARVLRQLMRTPASAKAFWDPPPAAIPDPAKLFAESVYVRGAMALEALRQQIGERAFLATLRTWAAQHRYSSASIAEFIALAEAQSGQELDAFFDVWLVQPGKPAV
jgi:aminopeptidase N